MLIIMQKYKIYIYSCLDIRLLYLKLSLAYSNISVALALVGLIGRSLFKRRHCYSMQGRRQVSS